MAGALSRAVSDADRGMTRVRRRIEPEPGRTSQCRPIEPQRVLSSVTENWPGCRFGASLITAMTRGHASFAARLAIRHRQVVQGKHLEQQVSTRRQRESDRYDGPDDVTHRP